MVLDTLKGVDSKTANGILAAAALMTSADPGIGEPAGIVRQYRIQADEILSEVRSRLKISVDDSSQKARTSIDDFLARALRDSALGANTHEALSRAGQAGRLSPALYQVVQPLSFRNVFSTLGISASHVEDAVLHPDDHQHLLAEGIPEQARSISLFMKLVIARDFAKSRWLLVQAVRNGTTLTVNSAWQVYPQDIDISNARQPLDVLRAFAEKYGYPIRVGENERALFVDALTYPLDATVKVDWTGAPPDWFVAFAQSANMETSVFKVGIAYCIDLARYRSDLRKHGVKVTEPSGQATSAPRAFAPAL